MALETRNGHSSKTAAELTGDLARHVTTLVHDELALARVEMTEKGRRAGVGAGILGTALVVLLFAAACVTACIIAALSRVIPVWEACLVVGVIYLIIGLVVAAVGGVMLRRASPPVPTETIETAKEDFEWIKTHASSEIR